MRKQFVMLVVTLAIPAPAPALAQADSAKAADVIPQLVARLDLERYKATIKSLTAFGDRREGTDRNRAALDWIEAQLKSYGCTNTERITYEFSPRPAAPRTAGSPAPLPTGVVGRQTATAAGGGRR